MTSQPPTLVHHFLEESARAYPDKVALIHDGVRVTYDEVNGKANLVARYLLDKGLKPGNRVSILMENSLEYVVSYYGVLKAAGVPVPLDTDLKLGGLKLLHYGVEPKWVISATKFEKLLQSADLAGGLMRGLILKAPALAWQGVSLAVQSLEEIFQDRPARNPDIEIQESSLASIIYTSGSTGPPKGVLLTHRNIVSNTFSICEYLNLTPDDIQMVVLPFFYVMGKSLLNTHFAAGGTIVINNKFAFPAAVLNEMVAEKVTGFSGVPSTYAYLLHRSPLAAYRDKLTALRYCSQAGGHMSRAIKEGLRHVLPAHTLIYIMYGATEASARLSYLRPERYADKMDSIGQAIPGVTLLVLDPAGNEAPPGQMGELVAAGPNIMQGYWKDPEGTAKVLNGAWYHTGDQAYQDSEGYFYLVGRKDDLLKVGGHRVNPREIEDTLMASGMLLETVVLGLPDGLLGHRLVTLAVPIAAGLNESTLLSYCAERLPKFKLPSEVKLARALPKNANGKIDRARCLDFLKGDQP
jgi:acyl-CoA synthetase (AMP-forming)/AMP-acid ligase II